LLRKKLDGRRDRHRRTVVTPHAINGNAGCHKSKEKAGSSFRACLPLVERLLALALDDLLAAVKTGRGKEVTQMHFTRGRLDSQRRGGQEVMSAMHATLGRGFFVLLNGHVDTPKKSVRFAFQSGQSRKRIDPLTCIGRTGQTTFFVPWSNWQGEEDFILNQLDHIQL